MVAVFLDDEGVRRLVYVVAGILPAFVWAVASLVMAIPTYFIWPLAAWIGLLGLLRTFSRRPYDAAHSTTSIMLVCGIAAMVPVAYTLLQGIPQWSVRDDGYKYALFTLFALTPVAVGLHYLYFQLSFAVTSMLAGLISVDR